MKTLILILFLVSLNVNSLTRRPSALTGVDLRQITTTYVTDIAFNRCMLLADVATDAAGRRFYRTVREQLGATGVYVLSNAWRDVSILDVREVSDVITESYNFPVMQHRDYYGQAVFLKCRRHAEQFYRVN